MSKQIGIFKMVTGEEIVTEFEDFGAVFTFSSPRMAIPVRAADGSIRLSLHQPWFMTAQDDDFTVDHDKVVAYTAECPSDVEALYVKQTTGIDLVTNSSSLIV